MAKTAKRFRKGRTIALLGEETFYPNPYPNEDALG